MAKPKFKNIKDTVFECDCGCGDTLSVGDFGDGQFSFAVKQTDDPRWHEVVIGEKDIKAIIEVLKT